MDLDDLSTIKNLDKGNALGSVRMIKDQVRAAWDEAYAVNFPESYKDIDNIIIAGMGGSAYGGRIIKSLFDTADTSRIPVELANGYKLPGYVSKKTLVFLCSYSGTTEETIACGLEALNKGVKLSGITSGGELGKLLKSHGLPAYIFNSQYNPSKQPRIGVGYMVVGLIAMLSKLGFLPIKKQEIDDTYSFLQKSLSEHDQIAKDFAHRLSQQIPIIIVADILEGAAHAIRNPFNETAKQFATYYVVSELNHHLMEGLQFPEIAKDIFRFIFIESDLYYHRNRKRMLLTRQVVGKNHYKTDVITLRGTTPFMQTMELIQLGNLITVYLALLHNIDPSPVPWVDYFKKELNK